MNIFLSGPMTGIEDYNYPLFCRVAEDLRSVGHRVFNPAEIGGGTQDRPYDYYMRFGIRQLADFHNVCLLSGWQESKGARAEILVAELCAMDFWEYWPENLDPPRLRLNNNAVQTWFNNLFARPEPSSATDATPREATPLRDSELPSGFCRDNPNTFVQVLVEMFDLHQKKGHDYGKETDEYENLREQARMYPGSEDWQAAMAEARSKLVRIKNFINRGELKNEPVRDAIRDAATYSAIGLALYNEAHPEAKHQHPH